MKRYFQGVSSIKVFVLVLILICGYVFLVNQTPKYIQGIDYRYESLSGLNATTILFGIEIPTIIPIGFAEKFYNGTIRVTIDPAFPAAIQNFYIKHENCHAEQFLQNKSVDEIECYVTMWSI